MSDFSPGRKRVITLRELPRRAAPLDPDAARNIFGGCAGQYISCNTALCCYPYTCHQFPPPSLNLCC